jgi:excisionase family DNA binding protein
MDTFLNVDEVAQILRTSRTWIYTLVRQKRIPYFRIAGKSVRFSQNEIEAWLQEGRHVEYHRDKMPINEKKV